VRVTDLPRDTEVKAQSDRNLQFSYLSSSSEYGHRQRLIVTRPALPRNLVTISLSRRAGRRFTTWRRLGTCFMGRRT
jgi:hypothetical protein